MSSNKSQAGAGSAEAKTLRDAAPSLAGGSDALRPGGDELRESPEQESARSAQLAIFAVPAGDREALQRLNRFLARHRILQLKLGDDDRIASVGVVFEKRTRKPERRETASWVHHPVLLWAVMTLAMLFTLHGKNISAAMLGQNSILIWHGAYTAWTYVAVVCGMALIFLVPRLVRTSAARISFVGSVAFALPVLVRLTSHHPSALVFFTQLYLCGAAAIVVAMTPYLEEDMPRKYWETLLAGVTKGMRFVFIFYAIAIAVLKFVVPSSEKGMAVNTVDFITSLFYPTFMLLVGVAVWCFWLVLPIWLKLHETWAEAADSLIALDDDEDEGDGEEPDIGPDRSQ